MFNEIRGVDESFMFNEMVAQKKKLNGARIFTYKK